jgi:hypothetical protein
MRINLYKHLFACLVTVLLIFTPFLQLLLPLSTVHAEGEFTITPRYGEDVATGCGYPNEFCLHITTSDPLVIPDTFELTIDGGDIYSDWAVEGDPGEWFIFFGAIGFWMPTGEHSIVGTITDTDSGSHPFNVTALNDSAENYMEVWVNDDPTELIIEAGSYAGFAPRAIEYRVNDGSWISLPASDGAYDVAPLEWGGEMSPATETASISAAVVPTGEQSIDVRVQDQWGTWWPHEDYPNWGYNDNLFIGTCTDCGPAVGASSDNAAEITTTKATYNLQTNTSAEGWIYSYINVPAAGEYYIRTYQITTEVDTAIQYFGTDNTYSTLAGENDDYTGYGAYSRYDFTAEAAGMHYFKVMQLGGEQINQDIGIRYVTEYQNITSTSVITVAEHSTIKESGTIDTINVPVNVTTENQFLLVGVSYKRASSGVLVTATKNGTSLTAGSCGPSGERSENYYHGFWYLSNPSTEAGDISISFAGTVEEVVVGTLLLNGVDPADPVNAQSCSSVGDQDFEWNDIPSITVASSAGGMVIGSLVTNNNINYLNPDEGQFMMWQDLDAPNTLSTAAAIVTESATTSTIGWTASTDVPWVAAGIALNPDPNPPSLPSIEFTEVPVALVGSSFDFRGTATSSTSTISSITATFNPDNNDDWITVTPNDGTFNSASEGFHINIRVYNSGQYTVAITVTAADNSTETYNFSVDTDTTLPEFDLGNFGNVPSADPTPAYHGVATTSILGVTISNVEYKITDGGLDVPWTAAIPTDGDFDSPSEEFDFTTPELPDSRHYVWIRVYDSIGNATSDHQGDNPAEGVVADRIIIDAVDSTAPVIELHQIVPNPTTDPQPKLQGKIKDNEGDKTSFIKDIHYKIDDGSWIAITPQDNTLSNELEEEFNVSLTGLSLGEHSVTVKASDTSDNSTDPDDNESITFTIIEQPELEAIKIEKNETFDDHEDQDLIGTNGIIWGNGTIKLKEEMNIEKTALSTTDIGSQYYYMGGRVLSVYPSQQNGIWMGKMNDKFSFYNNSSGIETTFNLFDFGGYSGGIVGDIAEIVSNNQYHVWLALEYGLLGVNFGTSITDGLNDSYIYVPLAPREAISKIFIDSRDPTDYGIYFRYTGGLGYFQPNTLLDNSDDVLVDYVNGDGYNVDNVTAIYLDIETDNLWLADYENGITTIADNGTPTNKADDAFTSYTDESLYYIFDIGKDKNDKVYFGGNNGLFILLDEGGTPLNSADDTIHILATPSQLGLEGISRIDYLPGNSVVGSQFLIGSRAGYITYLSINDTYTDHLDDQMILLDIPEGVFPAQVDDFYIESSNYLIAAISRVGIYRVDLNRQFVSEGVAVTKVDSQIEGRLDADFITLNSVDFDLMAGTVTFEVSNNGGITWYPITIGETVNFIEKDYRIKFRITMHRGSTAVISGFNLSYSAYPSEEERGIYLDIEDEPETVISGDSFAFTLQVTDDLENLFEDPTTVNVELRSVQNNEVVPDFNITNVDINSGIVQVDNAHANVMGLYYIYAYNSETSATSEAINFTAPSNSTNPPTSQTPTVVPTLDFYANKYVIKKGESVVLRWVSKELSELKLYANDKLVATVELNDSYTINLDETTKFELRGTGQYGNLTSSLTITIEEDEKNNDLPIISKFEVTKEHDENGTKVTLFWETENADYIILSPLNLKLAPNGSKQIYIDEKTKFTIVAFNDYGNVVSEEIIIEPFSDDKEPAPSEILILAPLAMGIMTYLLSSITTFGTNSFDIFRRIGLFIGILIRRKKKYWGIVYDVLDSKPLPFASIKVYLDGKFLAQTVSDLNGKYGVSLEKSGTYELICEAMGFQKYSKTLKVSQTGRGIEIIEDIPMIRLNRTFGLLNRIRFYSKNELFRTIQLLFLGLMIVGITYTIYATIVSPIAINFIILLLYFALVVINIIRIIQNRYVTVGRIVDSDSQMPLEGVSVRIYQGGTQVGIFLTNKNGLVKMNIKPGNYWIIVYKSGYQSFSLRSEDKEANASTGKEYVEKNSLKIGVHGYLTQNIKMKKMPQKTSREAPEVKSFANPFA